MKIKFKLGELFDILDQYGMLFEEVEDEWINADDGYLLRIGGYRVVISKLNVSFRTGELFCRNEDIEDSEADNAWDFVHSVDIVYKKDEKDPKEFLEYSTEPIDRLLMNLCKKNKYTKDEIDALNCYIETKEFIDEDIVRRLYPKNWKEAVQVQYPELFEVIKNQKYSMVREYDGTNIQIIETDFIYMNITLRPGYIWFQHCGLFTIVARDESEYPDAYAKIVKLTRDIVEKKIVILYVFSSENGRKIADMIVPSDDIRELTTDDSVMEYVQKKGVDMTGNGKWVLFTIDVYIWNEGRRRHEIWTNTI